jgi:antitoxin (DNA-binding transcriptional repressor) of toxin-antitoxin stability system
MSNDSLTERKMITISNEEIQKQWTFYLQRVEAGETFVIVREGKPVAEINPAQTELKGNRPFGLSSGLFVVPDDFNDPLPEAMLQAFEGK